MGEKKLARTVTDCKAQVWAGNLSAWSKGHRLVSKSSHNDTVIDIHTWFGSSPEKKLVIYWKGRITEDSLGKVMWN